MRLRNDKRVVRLEEAIERNTYWRGLSIAEKIESLRARRGASKRQIRKLTEAKA